MMLTYYHFNYLTRPTRALVFLYYYTVHTNLHTHIFSRDLPPTEFDSLYYYYYYYSSDDDDLRPLREDRPRSAAVDDTLLQPVPEV